MDCDQRHRLHYEDEGLIHAAVVRLVPSLQAAPDSDKGPWETGQPPGDAAENAGANVRHPPEAERACRRAGQEKNGVDYKQASVHRPVRRARKMHQEIDVGRAPAQTPPTPMPPTP